MSRRHPLGHGSRVSAALIGLLLLAPTTIRAQPQRWAIELEGRDITGTANPRMAGELLLVDAQGLAPLLQLTATVDGPQVRIVDRRGTEWRGQVGERVLTSQARVLSLKQPLLVEPPGLWIELGDVAGLAGVTVTLDRAARRVVLRQPPGSAPGTAAEGWHAFTLAKPAELPGTSADRDGVSAVLAPVLPEARERLQFTLGTGYVAGRDGALDALASGTVAGVSVAANAQVTVGQRGAQWHSGRVSFSDPVHRWRADAGDLSSEIDGLRRGARAAIDWSPTTRSAVSLYLPRQFSFMHRRALAVSYFQSVALGKNVAAAGELSSDGSAFASARFTGGGLAAGVHYRAVGHRRGVGAMGSYRIWQDVAVMASFDTATPEVARNPDMTRGMFDRNAEQSASYGVRFPLGGSAITLERRTIQFDNSQLKADGITLDVPFKKFRVLTRLQQGETVRSALSLQRDQRTDLTTIVSYRPAAWLNLNVSSARYVRKQRIEQRHEAAADLRLAQKTQLQVTAWSDGAHKGRGLPLRIRLAHQLTPRFDIVAEYGAFSAYQQALSYDRPELSRFRVVFRRRFAVATPARGGQVAGQVLDDLGRPVAGAVVRLGAYRTNTDEAGRYRFGGLPAGAFELYLDPSYLPAGYASHGGRVTINVSRSTNFVSDMVVAPLNVIRGRVFIDKNLNDVIDDGEQAAGVLVFADERPALTDRDGAFAFYNVEPGSYRLRLEARKLPEDLETAGAVENLITVSADRPVAGVEFRLKPRVKPVIFQKLK